MEKKVLAAIPEKYLSVVDMSRLQRVADVEFVRPDKDEVSGKIEGADVLLSLGFPIDSRMINAGKRLKMIQTMVVGYENIDVKTATEGGILVCNVAESNAESVAEFALALMLAVARRITTLDRLVREGKERLFMGEGQTMLWGKTLGIVGFGAIGRRVALKGRLALNMRLQVYDPFVVPEQADMFGGKLVDLDTLLRESDVISLHSSLSEQTRHMIGERELGLMKSTAILINTARGALVDEAALIKHLKEGKILGAGLDVFEKEPISPDNPLRKMENVVLSPHSGTAKEAETKMFQTAVDNVTKFILDGRAFRVVNPKAIKS